MNRQVMYNYVCVEDSNAFVITDVLCMSPSLWPSGFFQILATFSCLDKRDTFVVTYVKKSQQLIHKQQSKICKRKDMNFLMLTLMLCY